MSFLYYLNLVLDDREVEHGDAVLRHKLCGDRSAADAGEGLSACGFSAADNPSDTSVNLLTSDLDLFKLQSWTVGSNNLDSIAHHLAETVPDIAWVVWELHSLDGEGHDPLTSDQLSGLIDPARRLNYKIITVSEIVKIQQSN